MKIDIFNHLFPQRFFDEFDNTSRSKDIGKRVRSMPTIVDLDAEFRVMDVVRRDYCRIISLPMPPLETLAGPDQSPA